MKEFHQNLYDSGTKANYFDKLRDGGGVFSAFVITDMDETYSQALIDFQSSAPSCMKSIERNQIFELPLNEENHRLTFATITKHFPDCFNHKVLSKTFDQVDVLITKFIEILVNKQLTYEENGSIYDLVEAPIKDHIHVYFNNISSTSNKKRRKWVSKTLPEDYYMVPFHVDNGLYLMITPFSNHGLQIQHSDGEIISSSNLDTNSLIILFGRGLTEWLLQTSRKSRENFFPAPHAVPSFTSPTISYRSVYARMKVAPFKATPHVTLSESNGYSLPLKTFEEVFMGTQATTHTHKKHSIRQHHSSQLCSIKLENSFSPSQRRWKRQEGGWKKKMDQQCDEGEAFCWQHCLPLDQACPNVNQSQCIGTDDAPCYDDSMDTMCHWECKAETTTNSDPTQSHPTATTQAPDKPFCMSGASSVDRSIGNGG